MAQNGEAAALAARAKGVGWKVTTMRAAGGAYKIYMGDCGDGYCNHIMQIHKTPSDRNWQASVLREMNRHGLEKLEAKRDTKRANDKSARLDAARRAAEKRAAELLAQAGSIRKAAGPYAGPELLPLEWFLQLHPAPVHRWAIITPELARQILDKANTNNRKLIANQVDHYAGIIASNQWHLTHQGMAIDWDGVLQDGQHRLEAIHQAGITVPVSFYCGMDPNNWKAIDDGLARQANQLLKRLGEVNEVVLQACVKLVMAYQDGPDVARRAYHTKRTNEAIIDAFQGDADELREAAHWAARHKYHAKLGTGPLAAAYYLLRKKNGTDNPYVEGFWRGFITERKLDTRFALDEKDPRLAVKRQFVNIRARGKRVTGLEALSLLIIAWNHVVEGNRRGHIVLRDNAPIPEIRLCAPRVSAVPQLLQGEVEDGEAAA